MNLYDDKKAMPMSEKLVRLGDILSKIEVGSSHPFERKFVDGFTDITDPATINDSFYSQEDNKNLWELINKSKPSDTINLSWENAEDLVAYFDKHLVVCDEENKSRHYFPADLFFSKTVPLRDSEITIAASEDGADLSFRIVIFDNYKEIVDEVLFKHKEDCEDNIIGAIIINHYKTHTGRISYVKQIVIPISIHYGDNSICVPDHLGYVGFNIKMFDIIFNNRTDSVLGYEIQRSVLALKLWYTIQILLLHPNKNTIFTESRTPVESKVISKYAKAKNKKRKVKLIRNLRIHTDHLNDPIIESQGGIERKTLCWYVVGHWRTYKNTGKKIFIQPYWKGPLRETKQNLDLGRDREANLEDLDDDDE